MVRRVDIQGTTVLLAEPTQIPHSSFVGRETELSLCRVAWGISADGTTLLDHRLPPLHFRLEGAPGLGKNELVYEVARHLTIPLYIVQGHEELTPEDLCLLLVPDPESSYGDELPLVLRASPLATALYEGALFFFDEINRVPERALSPLSSVLDSRQEIYSALTGIHIRPVDEQARVRFRFCCALNPGLSHAGRALPEYIEQRTLPLIEVSRPPFEDIRAIVEATLTPSEEVLAAFDEWYRSDEEGELSVRQALALMNYVMSYGEHSESKESKASIFARLAGMIVPRNP